MCYKECPLPFFPPLVFASHTPPPYHRVDSVHVVPCDVSDGLLVTVVYALHGLVVGL